MVKHSIGLMRRDKCGRFMRFTQYVNQFAFNKQIWKSSNECTVYTNFEIINPNAILWNWKNNWQNRQYRRYRCCRHHRRNHHHHITENAIWNELKTTKSVKMMWFVNVYCAPRTNLRHFNLNACVCNTHFFFIYLTFTHFHYDRIVWFRTVL